MTEQHPMTDEMILKIMDTTCPMDPAYFGERHPSPEEFRAAYDKGAADKLEQVIEWLEKNLIKQEYIETYTYLYNDSYHRSRSFIKEKKLLGDLKKAMRPQQQSEGFGQS